MRRRSLLALVLTALAAALAAAALAPAAARPRLLVGANYNHVAYEPCEDWAREGILAPSDDARRALVRRQLAAMRASGIATIRVFVWHMTDPGRHEWGVVASAGGRLPDAVRANLAALADDVRELGFARLWVVFGPQWSNSPIDEPYDPSTFDENWRIVQEVRSLVRAHGPRDTRFDLLNEAGPSDYLRPGRARAIAAYVTRLWGRYVDAYGRRDATFSAIGASGPQDRGNRLANLIAALRRARVGLPAFWDVHANYEPAQVAYAVRDALGVLTREAPGEPLTVGELPYGDARVARALAPVVAADARLQELVQWPGRPPRLTCMASPPYRAGPYATLAAAARTR